MARAQWVARRALWIVIVALISAVLAVALAVWKLDFITDRNALIDPGSDFNARYLSFIRDFGDQEVMLLMIGPAPGPEGNPDYHPGVPGADTRVRMKGNVAGVAQIGNGSRAVTDQVGVNNTSGIIQIGNNQDVEVRQRGEGNFSVVVQSGYN
jgi:hypothetical protein